MSTITASQKPTFAVGDIHIGYVSYAAQLVVGETLTGTPTVTEQLTSDLTISSISINIIGLTINNISVAIGKAVQFILSGQLVENAPYTLEITVTTSTGRTLVRYVQFDVLPAMDTFATADDLYDIFGKANVWEWANMLELDPVTEAAEYTSDCERRIQLSLVYATTDIIELLRGGPYEMPFTAATITPTIVRCCAMKAGCWLFEWRRSENEDRYSKMEERADKLIEQIRKDVRRFESSNSVIKGTRAPEIIA